MFYFLATMGISWLLIFMRPLWLKIFSIRRPRRYQRVWAVDIGIALMIGGIFVGVLIYQMTSVTPEAAVLVMVMVISLAALWMARAAVNEYQINR